MNHTITTNHPIHELLKQRWSPYAFSDRLIQTSDLMSLFEAARWAPSSYNEQPWRFLVAPRQNKEAFTKVLDCLLPANVEWAQHASALVLAVTHHTFERNGKPNKAAIHDLGAAVSYLTFEATARDILMHQIIGIEPELAHKRFAIPSDHEVFTAFALGYANEEIKEEGFAQRDLVRRPRKALSEFVYTTQWGDAFT